MKTYIQRLLSFAGPVGFAVLALFLVLQNRQPPQQVTAEETARSVRVETVEARAFTPRVVGYGPVAPPRTWDAVAQVSGRVEFVHPDLRKGSVIPADTEIIRISPQDYELEVKRAEANLAAARAQLNELELQRTNIERSLVIERRSLELTRRDIARQQDLVNRAAASPATLETAERNALTQEARVQDLENSLELSPVQIEAQQTQIDVNAAQLEIAKLNLARTQISLPFPARISMTDVEETQFVGVGSVLASADDIGAAEVTAQIPLSQFGAFVRISAPGDVKIDLANAGRNGTIADRFGWRAVVRLDEGDQPIEWPAEIVRTADTIDPNSRTIGAIVSVSDPYRDLVPGVRPPLVKGMFAEVELFGVALADQIVVPRAAVRDGRVFVADEENRLRIRPVEVRAVQGDEALIADGLAIGDRVVLSDLSPAIDGMLLAPQSVAQQTAATEAAQ